MRCGWILRELVTDGELGVRNAVIQALSDTYPETLSQPGALPKDPALRSSARDESAQALTRDR